VSEGYY